jgi:hypothetical protein
MVGDDCLFVTTGYRITPFLSQLVSFCLSELPLFLVPKGKTGVKGQLLLYLGAFHTAKPPAV